MHDAMPDEVTHQLVIVDISCAEEAGGCPALVAMDRQGYWTAVMSPSCWRAVTPSSRPISSTIWPSWSRSTVVPVKCIFRPVAAGSAPRRKSLKAGPVWVPPPSQRPTTESPSAIRSAAPQKLRSGNALRKAVMKALMSSRPRRGLCSEYCNSMSGAARASTMVRSQVFPQNAVNQRPTMALLSAAVDIRDSSERLLVEKGEAHASLFSEQYLPEALKTLRFLRSNADGPLED